MNIKPEYHIHQQEKTWLKAKTTNRYAHHSSGESLFYLQELETGEGRVCFNTSLAQKIGLSFHDLQKDVTNAFEANKARRSDVKFETESVPFKDKKGNNMLFSNALKEMLAPRMWTYGADLQDGKTVNISAAPFSDKNTAKALMLLIEKNLVNAVNDFPQSFEKSHDALSRLQIDIYPKPNASVINNRLKTLKANISTQETENALTNHAKFKL